MPTLPGLVSNLALNSSSNATDIVGRTASGKGAVRARKVFTLFLLNKDMDDIIKIVLSLEKSGPTIDGASETVKPETKKTNKQESGFLPAMMAPTAALLIALMTSSLIQPVASSFINALPGRGVRREGKG